MHAISSFLAVVVVLASAACGGSNSSVSGADSPVAGTWTSTSKSADGRATTTVSWRFEVGGTWASSIATTTNGATTTVCMPAERPDTHWEDQGGKLALRAGSSTTDYTYAVTEGGARLRLDPAVSLGGSVTVNTYERAADAPLSACSPTR